MNKKTATIVIAALILLAVAILLIKPLGLFSINSTQLDHTELVLQSQDSNSVTYLYTWIGYPLQGSVENTIGAHGSPQSASLGPVWNPYSQSSDPNLVDGLQLDTLFPAKSIQFTTQAYQYFGGFNYAAVTTIQNNSKGTCRVYQDIIINGVKKAGADCTLNADLYASANGQLLTDNAAFSQITKVTALITIPKIGIECLDDSYCANPNLPKCISNICQKISCPSICTSLYAKSNNCILNTCGSGCGADNINTFSTLVACTGPINFASLLTYSQKWINGDIPFDHLIKIGQTWVSA